MRERNEFKPLSAKELAEDMRQHPDYYCSKALTMPTIQAYANRGLIPALQHTLKSRMLTNMGGHWTFMPYEIRLWIFFGKNNYAAIKVVEQRDYEKIAEMAKYTEAVV